MELTYITLSTKVNQLLTKLNVMGKDLYNGVGFDASSIILCENQDIVNLVKDRTDVVCFYLKTGTIELSLEKMVLLSYVAQDFIIPPVDAFSQLSLITKNSQVELVPITYQDVYSATKKDMQKSQLWNRFLTFHVSVLIEVIGVYSRFKMNWRYNIEQFQSGEIVIKQGDEAQNAYILLEGKADVCVNGHNIGHIQTGEIFGAIAVVTGNKRNADVIAKTNCKILKISKNDFFKFLGYYPKFSSRIIDDMAKVINRLNLSLHDEQS
ncbi:cyclic nucleotide-binding domain-containing protein [Legionella spiritensis]|uniref:Cyclic nucleotide-binding protein n=1 Tax=Legionella spiritensis TaxID=452 RepID=A0A0W0YXX6_LEGSP|nr:cyclic nucleotide-binding domain-containing protein [Legionella spiritensis]KTD61741.1 cyclic nucleotide-binding protein [Legionella spiritensis]SNV38664.1 cyclic nucleotide-binding protein [Legionella spiritensis]